MKGNKQGRKQVIKNLSLLYFSSVFFRDIVFAEKISPTLLGLMQVEQDLTKLGKKEQMPILNNRSWSIEPPIFLPNDHVTLANRLFERNNDLYCNS